MRETGARISSGIDLSGCGPPAGIAPHCTHNRGLVEAPARALFPCRFEAAVDSAIIPKNGDIDDFQAGISAGCPPALSGRSKRSPRPRQRRPSKGGIAIVIDPADREAATPPVAWRSISSRRRWRGTRLPCSGFGRSTRCPPTPVASSPRLPACAAAAQVLPEARLAPPRAGGIAHAAPSVIRRPPGSARLRRDGRGLTYALLELADRIRCGQRPDAALTFDAPLSEKPHNKMRSIGRLFVSDVEDKPWYHDRECGHRTSRCSRRSASTGSSSSLGIGYDSLRGVRDAYFLFAYPFLLSVPGYYVRAANLPDEERERNLEMLRFIGRRP